MHLIGGNFEIQNGGLNLKIQYLFIMVLYIYIYYTNASLYSLIVIANVTLVTQKTGFYNNIAKVMETNT